MHATVADTQALAEDLQRLWMIVGRTASGDFFRIVGESDLSLTQLKALYALGGGASLSIKQLSAALHVSEAAASRAAEGMVQRGYVHRRECPEDRRSRRLQLTAEGEAVRDRTLRARLAGLAEFVERLDPSERQALAAALSPIVERFSQA